MGYEIAGGLGVKMAAPEREVYVLVGDGSYLMMAQEIVTAVQEGVAITDRPARQQRLRQHRRAVGVGRQRRLRHALPRPQSRRPASSTATLLPIDLAANAESLGAHACGAPHADRGVPRRARRRAPRTTGVAVDRRPGRSRVAGRRLRLVVGRAGRRGVDDRGRPAGARGLRGRAAQGARLPVIRVANAPCSWGALEFDASRTAGARLAGARRDGGRRLRRHGARRLGLSADRSRRPWRGQSGARHLAMLAAFVPVALARDDAVARGRGTRGPNRARCSSASAGRPAR